MPSVSRAKRTMPVIKEFCKLRSHIHYTTEKSTAGHTWQLVQEYTPSQWGNNHHSMFHNPTAAVNLFHVGKQYLTLCKAEAAVTRNLIGRKIISNVKHADARNSLPILDVIRSSHKRHSESTANKRTSDRCLLYIYVLGAPSHFPTEYRQRRQWSVGNIG